MSSSTFPLVQDLSEPCCTGPNLSEHNLLRSSRSWFSRSMAISFKSICSRLFAALVLQRLVATGHAAKSVLVGTGNDLTCNCKPTGS